MSTIQIGRLTLGMPTSAPVEPLGDPVGQVGGAVVPAARTPMQMAMDLNTILSGRTSTATAHSVRRGLRSLLNNTPLKQQCFIYFQYADDPELNGWLIPAPATLQSPDAMAWKAVGLWETSSGAWYLAGRQRGMREARSVWMKDLRSGLFERDALEWITSVDFAAQPAVQLTLLPNGATSIQNTVNDQSIVGVALPAGRDGGVCMQCAGVSDLAYLSFERPEIALNTSDVVIYDRRGNLTTGPFYAANVLQDEPVSYWRLDETTGTNAVDQLGTNPGTYGGTFTLNQGGALAGGSDNDASVLLDGATGQVDAGNNPSANFTGAFALECWFKTAAVGATQALISKFSGTSGYGMRLSTTGRLNVLCGSVNFTVANPAVVAGTWHHAVVSYDGYSTIACYMDGALVGTTPFSSAVPLTTTHLQLGALASSSHFNGNIDECAIYNYALSPVQIANHYAAGATYDGGNQWEEVLGADYPWSWQAASGVAVQDTPVLSNGLVRLRFDSTNKGFRVDLWTGTGATNGTAGWVEQGKFRVERVGDTSGYLDTLIASSIYEYTPDRVVMLCVMSRASDTFSRERIFITLQRGALGFTVETYFAQKSTATNADGWIGWSPALNAGVSDLNNSAMKIDSIGSASTTVASASNGVNVNTFAGAAVLNVASTASFATAGTLVVPTTGGTALVTYTGTTSTTFTGCTLVGGASSGTMATGQMVGPYAPASANPGASGTAAFVASAGTGVGAGNSGQFGSVAFLGRSDFINSENWAAVLREPTVYNVTAPYQVTFVTLQSQNVNFQYGGADTNMYGTGTFAYRVRSQNGAGYVQTQIVFSPTQSDQVNESESFRNAGSVTTSQVADAAALANPAAAATGVVSAGGAVPVGTFYYVYTGYTASGETARSAVSAGQVTTSGNQTVTLTLTAITGATGYNVYRGTSATGPWTFVGTTTTTSYVDTSATTQAQSSPAANNSGQTSSGAAFVMDTQTAATAATLTKTSNLLQASYRAFARVRTDAGATGSFKYSLGPSSATSTITNTTWTWVDLGEVTSTAANAVLTFTGWTSAGVGNVYIDRVELAMTQDRTRSGAIYSGSRDQSQGALYDSRTIGALAAR